MTTTPPNIAKDRANRSIALLDEHCPGWRDVIDTSTLNIRSLDHCPLAQIGLGLYDVDSDDAWWEMHGRLEPFMDADLRGAGFADNDELPYWLEALGA